ncbi:MAG: hypothetical protein ACK4UY_00760 [Dietzia sp.]
MNLEMVVDDATGVPVGTAATGSRADLDVLSFSCDDHDEGLSLADAGYEVTGQHADA